MSDLELALVYLDNTGWLNLPDWIKGRCFDLVNDICQAAEINPLRLWGPQARQYEVELFTKAAKRLLK